MYELDGDDDEELDELPMSSISESSADDELSADVFDDLDFDLSDDLRLSFAAVAAFALCLPSWLDL